MRTEILVWKSPSKPGWLTDRSRPHARNRRKLIRAAHQHARTALDARGIPAPKNKTALLHTYLQDRDQSPEPRCPVCQGLPINPGATYCSPACKQKAYRDRRKSG